MEKLVRKLYQGNIDLRSHDVDQAINEGDYINVTLVDSYKPLGSMRLSPEQLSHPVATSDPIASKFEGNYKLLSYPWKPEDKSQLTFDI
jgi:hypothetical protein